MGLVASAKGVLDLVHKENPHQQSEYMRDVRERVFLPPATSGMQVHAGLQIYCLLIAFGVVYNKEVPHKALSNLMHLAASPTYMLCIHSPILRC